MGVPLKTLRNHAEKEGWTRKRAEHKEKVVRNALAHARAKETKRLEKLMYASNKICGELEKITKNIDRELHTHSYTAMKRGGETDGMRAEVIDAIDDKKLVNLTRALSNMTNTMCRLYDIQTAHERASIEQGAEKIAIMRRAQEAKEDTNRIEEINVVLGDGLEDYKG